MASNKAPKHDFAPAWLKIPDPENHKSTGSKHAEQDRPGWGRRDDYYGERRYPPSKNRHHSVDEDYYKAYYGYYNNGYPGWYGNGNFRSQPSLNRESGSKYQHGGSRYPPNAVNSFRPPMGNSGYGYGGYDYYEPYYSHPGTNRPPSAAGRRIHDARRADKENKQAADKKKKEANLEEDFPSLNGEFDPVPDTKPAKTLNNSGVWEKSPISKIKSPSNNGHTSSRPYGVDNPREIVKHNPSNIYKALIPNKASLVKKSNKDSMYGGRDINSNTSSFSKANKESRIISPTMDVLNTRTVTQPKKLTDKKSDFLKQLKQETNGDLKQSKQAVESEERLVNGVSDLSVASNSIFATTTLEDEQRLLKEMGWTEDDEEYVITEDDKKEMQKSIQLLKQQRNGFKRAALPKLWSPQHHGVIPPPDSLLSSSSSDDSDTG